MKRWKKITLWVVVSISVLFMLMLWGAWKYSSEKMEKAREAEAKMNLATIYTSEQAFGREYFKFSADLEELGFVPEGEGDIQYFLDADDIPADLKLKLSPDELPMVADDGFRALAIITRDDGITVLTIDSSKKISIRRE